MVSKRILIASSIAIICMVQLVACRPDGDDDEEDSKPAAAAADEATPGVNTKLSPKPPVSLKPKLRQFAIIPTPETLKDDKEKEEEEEEKEKKPKPKKHNYIIRKIIALPKLICSPFISIWNIFKRGTRHFGLFKKKIAEEED